MFNYIKETIINDVTNKVVKDGTLLIVKRGGNYDCNKICDKKVFKTAGNAGTVATLTIDPSKFTGSGVDYRQFAIFVQTPNMELSDYAFANWYEFGKPILVESSATSADDLAEAFKLVLSPDNPFYTVSVSSSKVVLTFAESWMKVTEAKVWEHKTATDTMEELTTSNTTVITDNVEEFATADWLVENLRFPSYPNRRYNALYSDEAPVKGTIYTQYAFQYITKHSVPGGLSAVGQHVDSITTHVFYVPSSDASTFEGKFSGVEFVTDTAVVASMDPAANEIAAAEATAEAASTSTASTTAPTTATVGKIGDTIIYNGDIYTCTAIDTSGDTPSYTWTKTFDHTA